MVNVKLTFNEKERQIVVALIAAKTEAEARFENLFGEQYQNIVHEIAIAPMRRYAHFMVNHDGKRTQEIHETVEQILRQQLGKVHKPYVNRVKFEVQEPQYAGRYSRSWKIPFPRRRK